MDELIQLNSLSQQMDLEADGDVRMDGTPVEVTSGIQRKPTAVHVTSACMAGGKKIKLLKTMLSSYCERDCRYCGFRSERDCQRSAYRPDDFARLVSDLHRRQIIEGAFLSSGITGGGASTQDRLIDTAVILRSKFGYRGYLHLKIMPGAEKEQVEKAMQLADRVSVNLEAPNPGKLETLAPGKVFIDELLEPLRWVHQIRSTKAAQLGWMGRWPSSTTQFVAGGADECDSELLRTTVYLYRAIRLKRVYYMAFKPVPSTPLSDHPITPELRQLRLYQASFLLRDYGYDMEEMPFTQDGNLPLEKDPKSLWASRELSDRPVELNRADREMLLRIPGIGIRGADAILRLRRHRSIKDLSQLRNTGIRIERAAGYVLLDGRKPPQQLSFL
jgi:predicted DNA-binding helix-hairpin-helix protein